jgi:hypothetical protein
MKTSPPIFPKKGKRERWRGNFGHQLIFLSPLFSLSLSHFCWLNQQFQIPIPHSKSHPQIQKGLEFLAILSIWNVFNCWKNQVKVMVNMWTLEMFMCKVSFHTRTKMPLDANMHRLVIWAVYRIMISWLEAFIYLVSNVMAHILM